MPVYFSAFLRCVGLSTVWIITNYCDPFSAFAILLPASSAEYRIQSVWLFFAVIQLYVADVIPCICVITILFPLTAWCRVISQHIIGLWIECYWRNVNRVITFKQIVTINGHLCPPLIVTEGYATRNGRLCQCRQCQGCRHYACGQLLESLTYPSFIIIYTKGTVHPCRLCLYYHIEFYAEILCSIYRGAIIEPPVYINCNLSSCTYLSPFHNINWIFNFSLFFSLVYHYC